MPSGGSSAGALRSVALGGDADQLVGDLADALLQPRLLRLPGAAAELVEQPLLVAEAAEQARCSRPAGTAGRRRRIPAPGIRAARPSR
jgi:hypothetical protein